MTTDTRVLPPPALGLPAGAVYGMPLSVGPVPFRSFNGSKSGSRGTVFVDDHQPGTVSFTGEFYSPSVLRGFRVGQVVLSLVMIGSLIGAALVGASTKKGESASPVFVVMLVLAFAAIIAMLVWKVALNMSVRSAAVQVRTIDVQRLMATPNWGNMGWWLLIGPLALIVVFSGRRLLKAEVPWTVDGRLCRLHLILREQRRGDADMVVARLRMSGAR
jgi:hypothetical protein